MLQPEIPRRLEYVKACMMNRDFRRQGAGALGAEQGNPNQPDAPSSMKRIRGVLQRRPGSDWVAAHRDDGEKGTK